MKAESANDNWVQRHRALPEAQFAAGPPVENGFYYDVDLPHRIRRRIFRGSLFIYLRLLG